MGILPSCSGNFSVQTFVSFSASYVYSWLTVQLAGQPKEAIFLTEQIIVHIINHKEKKEMFSNTSVKDWMNP